MFANDLGYGSGAPPSPALCGDAVDDEVVAVSVQRDGLPERALDLEAETLGDGKPPGEQCHA